MNMSHIRFTGIHKYFRKRHILKGAELYLQGGKCTLLSGINGAGKSTLLRICAGLEKPDQGNVDTGLGSQSWKRYRHTLHSKTVYLHQHPYMFDGTVQQNLAYALPRNMSRLERKQHVAEAVQWAKLESIADNPAKPMSGGERQRIAIARAWLRAPAIMLLDEPTANMDRETRWRTIQLLHSLKDQGIALLIASHDPEHFSNLVDEWLELRHGKIDNRRLMDPVDENIVPLQQTQQA